MTLEELAAALSDAERVESEARLRVKEAEAAWVTAKAESIGLRVGSVVFTEDMHGNRKVVKKRYRVSAIVRGIPWRTHGLTLYGITIRSDGTDGQGHEIWRDWQIEK